MVGATRIVPPSLMYSSIGSVTIYSWSLGPKSCSLTYLTIFWSRSGDMIYFDTLMRLEGASSGVGFSTTSTNLPSFAESTPYFSTFDLSISTPRMAESVSSLIDLIRASAADSPSGFQIKSSPIKTKTGSLILYSSTTIAIGTAVPYLLAGSWIV